MNQQEIYNYSNVERRKRERVMMRQLNNMRDEQIFNIHVVGCEGESI